MINEDILYYEDRVDLIIDRIIRKNKRSVKAIKLARTKVIKNKYGGNHVKSEQ